MCINKAPDYFGALLYLIRINSQLKKHNTLILKLLNSYHAFLIKIFIAVFINLLYLYN